MGNLLTLVTSQEYMDNEYIADYEKEYGNDWVSKMIEQENERDAQIKAKAEEWKKKNKKNT